MHTQWCILLGEDVEASRLKGHVVRGHNVPMDAQVESVVKLAIEIAQGDIRFGNCLEHHFSLRSAMFHQQYFAKPALAHNLNDIEFIHQLDLLSAAKNIKKLVYFALLCCFVCMCFGL